MIETSVMKKIGRTYSYAQYRDLVVAYATEGKTSGEDTPAHVSATSLNAHRMLRIDKTTEITEELIKTVHAISQPQTWMIIAETWCGDGAQIVPVLARIAGYNSKINFQIILRDENPEIMDAFLTNGARAIPKLIITNSDGTVMATWGPRPKGIQEMVADYKKANPGVSHDEFVKNVQLFYSRDKAKAIQEDILQLLKNINS